MTPSSSRMRETVLSRKRRSWLTTSTPPGNSPRNRSSQRSPPRSRWLVGSSRSRIVGRPRRTPASITRACSPPERSPNRAAPERCAMPRCARASSIAAWNVQPSRAANRARTSSYSRIAAVRRSGPGHLGLELAHPLVERVHLADRALEIAAERRVRVRRRLVQERDPVVGSDDHPARVGMLDARQDAKERRLSGAVGPDEGCPLAPTEGEGRVREERLGVVRLAQRV